jgi:hypothetical protein
MKKNDKIIVLIGITILILASIGIYYWVPEKQTNTFEINDFIDITGNKKDAPGSITVSDSNPFFSLIATPLAVNYDENCKQNIIPLFIMNFDNPSSAITGLQNQLDNSKKVELIKDDESAKNASLRIAESYWGSSEAALIIEYSENGYNLGVLATPIASYLRIPIIVTDELDIEVMRTLSDLGVTKTLICGENIEGFGDFFKLTSVDDVINMSIEITEGKFNQEINYITLTNPVDAWPPQVLDSKEFNFGPVTLKSFTMSQLVGALGGLVSGGNSVTWSFQIPDDYKYALIKFEGINHDAENCDEMGDAASFTMGPNLEDIPSGLQKFEAHPGTTSAGGIAERDASGKIIKDIIHSETVVYDRGGVEYNIVASGNWLVKKQGKVSAHVVVEKLENPVYPMMKGLSSVAPYLTAYHKGIVFGRPEFAFTADDDKITDNGENCPGIYVGGKNPKLVPLSNKHFFDEIHDPLNKLLAKIADLNIKDIKDKRDIKVLREFYKNSPIYIALVGDATVLPNYIYQNHAEPIGDIDGDGIDDTPYYAGGGTPSDVLYGNIDPVRYDWSNTAGDIYSDNGYPFIENIVGRITGWDSQDAMALVLKSVFYKKIVNNLDEWRNNFGLLVGGGQDFQKPLIRYIIFGDILKKVKRGEPMKMFTGYGEMTYKRAINNIVKSLEFNLQGALYEDAMKKGLSEDTLTKIKSNNFINKLLFNKMQVRNLAGEGTVKGGEIIETSNFIFANGHGNQYLFGMAGNDIVASGIGGPLIKRILIETLIPIAGGFLGPGGDLSGVGDYSTRSVSNMNLGPSFMWLESCICGKLDGMYAKANVGQSLLHAGLSCLIASPTGSNIGGGYLEPKNTKYDLPLQVQLKYLNAKKQWDKEIFPKAHFGEKIYEDTCNNLKKNDVSIGLAFRNAKNNYLPTDADWQLWWSPPLNFYTGNSLTDYELAMNNYSDLYKSTSSKGLSTMLESKYVSFQEYILFGDPALNLYEPCNEGK